MKKCKSCQKEIDVKAKKCPFCQTDQRNWFIKHPILTTLLALFVIGLIGSSGDKKSPSTNQDKNTISVQPSSAQESKVTTAPLTMEEKLQQITNKVLTDNKSTKVNYDNGTQTATITWGEGSDFFDEKLMIQGAINVFVEIGLKAFKLDGVKNLVVATRTNFTDSYGKNVVEDAVRLSMTRDEFQKFDWNNLKYHPIYNSFNKSATEFYIHPGIFKNLSGLDDIFLDIKDK